MKINDLTKSTGEVELVEHALAMEASKDPAEARHGRATKALGVAYAGWFDAESERSEYGEMAHVLCMVIANMLTSFTFNTMQAESRNEFIEQFCGTVAVASIAALKHMDEEDAAAA